MIDKSCAVGMAVVANLNTQDLFDVEAYPMGIQSTVLIVNLHLSLSDFIWHENVLVEDT